MPLIVEFVTAEDRQTGIASEGAPAGFTAIADRTIRAESSERRVAMREQYSKEDARQGREVKPMRFVLGASILGTAAALVAVAISVSGA